MADRKTFAALVGGAAGLASARAVDLALIGAGVATATGAVGFAGYMMLAGDHEPRINGMEYLAIFAQPSRHAARDAETADSGTIDVSPLGALPRGVKDNVGGYWLVGAQPQFAWLREGNRIFSVRPGEEVPRLGRIAAIVERDGRWTLVDSKGAALIVSGQPELSPSAGAKFGKRMIFGE